MGWKGFLYDPNLDGSSNMQLGLEKSRDLYLKIIEMGLPIASEILSPMATAYFDDLLAWGAIGARTSESQIHREISSHMPYSIGFKMVLTVRFKLLWMPFSLPLIRINSWE